MKTNDTIQGLLERIGEYRRKFYINQLAKGVIFAIALVVSSYLLVNALEYFGRFGTTVRGAMLFGFLAVMGYAAWRWVIDPLVHLYGIRKPISDEAAALQIGKYFPEIGDKLLNTLQLQAVTASHTDLIEASIRQRSKQLMIVRFSDAIQINQNRRYLKYALYPLLAIVGILLFNPSFFKGSSNRIINFQKNYSYAPFTFQLDNPELKAFRNEDFTLRVSLAGGALPESVYLIQNQTKFKLEPVDGDTYEYTFRNIQRPIAFQFEAAGYKSDDYKINLAERPNLLAFDVTLQYPAYLGKPSEQLSNVGNMTIPEGTTINWDFDTEATEEMSLQFEGDKNVQKAENKLTGGFEFRKQIRRSGNYQINLKNDESSNKEKISYFLNVIPDKVPQLSLENYQDTTLFNYLVVGGNITDDYGFTNLKLFYNIRRKGQEINSNKLVYKGLNIPFNKSATSQTFYYQWFTDSLALGPGDKIEYFVQVWDNDGVNGPKSAKSRIMDFAVPSKDEVRAEAEKSSEKTENEIEKVLQKAKNLEKEIEKLDNRLKSQKELDFQDKKQIEDLLQKREELMQDLKKLQEQNQMSQEKQQRFQEQSPELKQKMAELQKLMNQLMDPETKKLYDQLEKMMDQQQQDPKMQELMNRLKNKEMNMEKEIEKALEMFKQMKLEQKAEQIQKDLEEQAKKQDELAEQAEKNAENKEGEEKKQKNEDLEKKQEEANKEFEKTKEDVKELEKMNDELKKPEDIDTDKESQEDVDKEQDKSKKDLEKQDSKSAAKSQKKAAKSMRNMAAKMGKSMEGAEMQESEENMDQLRDILENLIHLSFEQERVMKEFRGVSMQDPRFVKLSQDQLKLQDDGKVIEDSLYALAKRVRQIETFVTRELNDMRFHMTESARYIKERKINLATSKQQFSMTSMNNLSLMLSQTLQQMQQQMMAAGAPGSGKGKQKGKGKSPSNIGELQKQLNERIKQLQQQGSGQGAGGRQMSEQLAQMAAQQGRIRQMMQQLMDSQKGTDAQKKLGNEVNELMKDMDETETDLVNKRLNNNLLKRQQDIVTRLLESEKALRQQEEDTQRKSEVAKPKDRRPPSAFDEYVRDKQRQTELLRTVPPSFVPFYKREVDSYFKKSGGK
jgi:hypothetical protein